MSVAAKHKQDEENVRLLREAAAASSAQAVRQVREHQLVITMAEGGQVVEIRPDGNRTVLKALAAPRLGLTKGTKISYR